MKKICFIFLISLFLPLKSNACFGPELIIGYEDNKINYYVVSIILELYIKEKTGVGTKIIPITDRNILNLLKDEKVDILLIDNMFDTGSLSKKIFTNDKKYNLYYRTNINEDLRFTTVMEAIDKLSKNINSKDISTLIEIIKTDKQERRVVREFLMKRGLW